MKYFQCHLEEPTDMAVPRWDLIYVSFESHLSKLRSRFVVHMVVFFRKSIPLREGVGNCMFILPYGGSTKTTVRLYSVWKLSRPMSAVQNMRMSIRSKEVNGYCIKQWKIIF